MALRKQPLPIQFTGGVETKADPKGVPATRVLDLKNAQFTKATTLSKRNGYAALSTLIDPTAASYGTPVGLASHNDELIAFSDNGHAYSYRESADRWVDTGEVSSTVARCTPLGRTGTVQVMPDVAIRNGVQVLAWEDSRGGVWCSVLEEATGRVLLGQTQLDANGKTPRCLYVDQVLHVIWAQPTSKRLYVAVINPAMPSSTPSAQILTEDLSATNPAFDAESFGPVSTGEPGVIAWALDGGGYRVGYLAPSGVIGSPLTGFPTSGSYADAITGAIAVTPHRLDGDSLAVVWGEAAVTKVRFIDAASLSLSLRTAAIGPGSVSCNRIACAFGAFDSALGDTPLYWILQQSGSRTDLSTLQSGKAFPGSTTTDSASTTLRGHVLLSRAFYDGKELTVGTTPTGHVYAFIAHSARLFPYAGCLRLSATGGIAGGTATMVSRLLPGESAGTHMRRISAGPTGFEEARHVSSVVDVGRETANNYSRIHATPLCYRIQLESENGDQFSEVGIRYCSLDFDHAASYQAAKLGRGLYLASSAPQHYDGDRWVEADYHAAPDWGYLANGSTYTPSSAYAIAVGGSVNDGTHVYKIWYEDVDAQGEVHPGAVSAGVTVTTGGGANKVIVTIPTYRLTNKRRVRICVARAVAGATGTDEDIALYRVTGLDPGTTTGDNCMLFNDPAVDTVSFTDAMSDATLLTQEPLYTNGGIRSNDPAPWAGDVIAGGKSRLFWTDPSNPDLVRYSKSVADDTGLEAPTTFSLPVDPFGGSIVGIGVMDDVVYPMKETAIYAFGGSGPLAAPDLQPELNSFTPAALVTSDVGLQSPTSIGPMPLGLIFKSTKGIVLLGRDRQVARIGGPVDGYNDQRVTRTTLLPDRPHVLMLTDSGRTLLFDYERGQWSTFTQHEGHDACVVDGVYNYLRTDGRVFRETPGEYADDNLQIRMSIETAWIKMTGYLQGWQRTLWAFFLGTWKSPHTLRVYFRIDYNEAWQGPYDMAVDANYDPALYGEGAYGVGAYGGAGGATTVLQRRLHLNQRCQSIQFRIEDVESSGNFGASFELSELLLIGGVLGPSFPVGAARSG